MANKPEYNESELKALLKGKGLGAYDKDLYLKISKTAEMLKETVKKLDGLIKDTYKQGYRKEIAHKHKHGKQGS